MGYKVILETFEGPLDLLCHLIEKSKIDIYDIPISEITDQYLDYLKKMNEMDLEVTSEFLVMASTLLEIKSKMLLPKEKNNDGEQLEIEEDPREELVTKLIEYKKYKEVAKKLKSKENIQKKALFKPKEEIEIEDNEKIDLKSICMEDLVKAFNKVLKKRYNYSENLIDINEIEKDDITIEEGINKITTALNKKNKIKFNDLFNNRTSIDEVIVIFLSILELIKQKKIIATQKNNFSDILICLKQ